MSGLLSKEICVFFNLFFMLEMIEDSEDCEKMFNEVNDGRWDINNDNDNDV